MKKKIKKIFRTDQAVTELIGTMILLLIAVSVMAFVYVTVFSDLEPEEDINCEIVGRLESGDVVFTHYGGDSLDLNSSVTIELAGQSETFVVGDHLDSESSQDGVWNIGERLVLINYTNLQSDYTDLPNVFGKIRDVISNSLVFYGTIQDGEFILNRGGIWHFDEGSGLLAYDSLDYNPPGIILGADWAAGINNTCLDFDGNNRVTVVDSNSLDMKDNISIEAWMKPSNNILLTELELDAAFGYYPNIINVNDEIYAVAYTSQAEKGVIKTIEITSEGYINQTIKDTLIFDSIRAFEPRIIHIYNDIYGIVYEGSGSEGELITINISSNGTISDSIVDTFTFDTSTIIEPDIIHIANDIYGVAYGDKSTSKGVIQTIQILNDGTINASIDTANFNPTDCEDPEIIHITGNIYAITYIKSSNICSVRTLEITPTGTVATINIDELQINNDDADDPNIIHISGDIYSVAYSFSNENFGEVASFTIDLNGNIGLVIDRLLFDDAKCADPCIIENIGDSYMIAYTSTLPHIGYVKTMDILPNGQISDSVNSIYVYGQDQGYEPDIIHITGNVFVIAYRGWSPHTGHVGAINPTEISLPENSGITKQGAYGIFVNQTHAFATINNVTIFGPINFDWNHIALTYDRSTIRLYSNGVEIANTSYSNEINRNSNNLLFGVYFNGEIDEIFLYDTVLSPAEIVQHYNEQKP